MEQLTLKAIKENTSAVMEFIDAKLEEHMCPIKVQMQIDIAIDEIYSNIANYAYHPETGDVTIQFDYSKEEECVYITFMDSGIEYNPLAKQDPDVTLSLEEREIGGLGIFVTKKIMDDVQYEYKDKKNILILIKHL